MTDEDYQTAQEILILAAKLLAVHDWAAFNTRINRAETVGVFLMAPFAYQNATERTRHIGEMASAAQTLVRGFDALNGVVLKQEARP